MLQKDFSESELENLSERVFLKSIELLGGLSSLIEYRNLAWLAPLLRAVYCVVLREEYFKEEEEIAQYLGITVQTVKNILRGETAGLLSKLQKMEEFIQEEGKELRVHTAGVVAHLAYRLVKENQEELSLSLYYCERVARALDMPWAYLLLKRLRKEDFPIKSHQSLNSRLEGIYIKGRTAMEVFQEIEYPIQNPLELLRCIKENLKMHGLE